MLHNSVHLLHNSVHLLHNSVHLLHNSTYIRIYVLHIDICMYCMYVRISM